VSDFMGGPEVVAHFDKKKRTAMARMAQACQLDLKKYAQMVGGVPLAKIDRQGATDMTWAWGEVTRRMRPEQLLRLWTEVSEAIAGGVPSAATPIPGDPFAIFLTGICRQPHGTKGPHEQTAVVKTGHRVDQAEGEKILAYLKAQQNVNTCEVCGDRIVIWQADNTRVSTFAGKGHVLVGSDQP